MTPQATDCHFRVGGHRFRITLPFGEEALPRLLPSTLPFVIDPADDDPTPPLFVLTVKRADDMTLPPTLLTEFDWEDAHCRILTDGAGRHLITLSPHASTLTYHICCHHSFAEATLALHDAPTDAFVLNNALMMLYSFTSAPLHTLMMHASVVACEGRGYLFLGKSGTGKSTHSRLWLDNIAGSELLNDDNPVVRIDPQANTVTVYGSPWSGKTPCYRNLSYPVGAFVSLEQAPENEITRRTAAYALADLLPSCSCLREEPQIYHGVMESAKHLAAHIPTYHLRCLPDAAAALLC
ncbi:MAG: hypothetical protein LBL78_05750, partial [Prevotellaceae bacterium]|nr:hypothetical protein [Prevotellaceae bacterium]